ncbi:hypothetical protein BU15DRAFT_64142 [Melanogaster broomeanus]|nr:hypothetical protein BU15DRAFT_64142 [Melanogaster broomeanus]
MVADPETAFGLVAFMALLKFEYQRQTVPLPWAVLVWLGFSITADILIAGSLCYILKKNRSGVARKLMTFVIQTGLITSIAAGVTVAIKWTAAKLDTRHLWMSFPMGGIYATCLMAKIAYEDTELAISRGSVVFTPPESFAKSFPEPLEPSTSERSSETSTLNVSAVLSYLWWASEALRLRDAIVMLKTVRNFGALWIKLMVQLECMCGRKYRYVSTVWVKSGEVWDSELSHRSHK